MRLKKLIKAAAVTGGALFVLKGLDNRLEVTHYDVESEKIPAVFNGFKILQISDFHSEPVPGLVEEISREAPNIIVSTGDLADDDGSYLPALRLCEHLTDIAPVYAITGNHDLLRSDYEQFERELAAIGVVTLHNERKIFTLNGGEFALSGIDDPFTNNTAKAADYIHTSVAKFTRYNGFEILLFHRANLFDHLKAYGFDLILSGHMHGGQFRLPTSGKGLVSPRSGWTSKASMFFPKYVGGRYRAARTEMIVNRGTGNPMIIPRLFNRPEITVITLKNKKEK